MAMLDICAMVIPLRGAPIWEQAWEYEWMDTPGRKSTARASCIKKGRGGDQQNTLVHYADYKTTEGATGQS